MAAASDVGGIWTPRGIWPMVAGEGSWSGAAGGCGMLGSGVTLEPAMLGPAMLELGPAMLEGGGAERS